MSNHSVDRKQDHFSINARTAWQHLPPRKRQMQYAPWIASLLTVPLHCTSHQSASTQSGSTSLPALSPVRDGTHGSTRLTMSISLKLTSLICYARGNLPATALT